MSNLKTKAKPLYLWWQDRKETPVDKQLVQFEDAQKEIERLNQAYSLVNNSLSNCAKTGRKYLEETEKLEAKIEAANKALTGAKNHLEAQIEGIKLGGYAVHTPEHVIELIEEIQSILIPRIDEQRSGESGSGAGDGSDPKKCPSLPIGRRQPTSKTPRKEEVDFPSPTKQQEILEEAMDYAKNSRKEKAKRERCKFLIDKDDAGGRQWKECSYHLDTAECGNCNNCSLYTVEKENTSL